jgi:hypothetical protein
MDFGMNGNLFEDACITTHWPLVESQTDHGFVSFGSSSESTASCPRLDEAPPQLAGRRIVAVLAPVSFPWSM